MRTYDKEGENRAAAAAAAVARRKWREAQASAGRNNRLEDEETPTGIWIKWSEEIPLPYSRIVALRAPSNGNPPFIYVAVFHWMTKIPRAREIFGERIPNELLSISETDELIDQSDPRWPDTWLLLPEIDESRWVGDGD
jgi:hypothetical protein